ncbi:MAG TPA: hypothetical protein VN642_17975 [Dongiaceae bacterium]|nr:hypothetical protein [Dongiaceae bacterium]
MFARFSLIFSVLVSCCVIGGVAGADGRKETGQQTLNFASHRGQFFSWAAPAGWKSSETMSGLTLTSPNESEAVMYAILLRSQGQANPMQFMQYMLSRLPGYANIKVVSSKQLPDQRSGIPGTTWKVVEAEMSYSVNGRPFRAVWTCGINNYYGMYDASMNGYQASADSWSRSRVYLPAMSNRIAIINPRQIAGNDTLIPVRNRPLDNSGILESGRLRDESRDRTSKKNREGIMGQERVKDPTTGEIFTMPLNNYDPAAGGYRNPKRPDELLVPTSPGE